MKKTEICLQCNVDYLPTRRGLQKYCSKSCKSRYNYLKQNNNKKELLVQDLPEKSKSKTTVENMSWAGVGDAAAGSGIVELGKYALGLTVTKQDIQELKSFIRGRYLPVNNAGKDAFGRSPYYDVETGHIVHM
jgi:hypothetical protein